MSERTYLRPTGFVDAPFGHDGKVARLAGGLLWFAQVEIVRDDCAELVPVDGFEARVMAGAERLLQGGRVASWAIEMNGSENFAAIDARMKAAGYVEADRFEHYPGITPSTVDVIYLREQRLSEWRSFAGSPRG